MTTDNDPNIILRLEAHGHRAHNLWAHPHNEAFYLPPLSEATNGGLREIVVSPDDWSRELTPGPRDPGLIKVTEPALQITFSKKPKNPELGYLLGSDPESCDIILGSMDDCISHRMFAISFNQYNEVIMETMSRNTTVVTYGGQTGTRRNFTWLFPPGQSNIFVKAAETITFKVIVPTHNTDKAAYEANCRDFMQLANSASHTMGLLNFSSLPETRLASGAATAHTTVEPPFYLRTKKLGNGGFGVVHKIRSMPDGGTAAMKEFKAKNIWTLEARVLRKLVDTPHVSTEPRFIRTSLTHHTGEYRQVHRLRARRQAVSSDGALSWGKLGSTTQNYVIHHPGSWAHPPSDVERTRLFTQTSRDNTSRY